jgi:type IV pilus assembly protein PilO
MDFARVFAPIVNQPRPTKIALGAIVLVVIVGSGYFLLISPRRAAVEEIRARFQSELTPSRAVAANLARFRGEAAVLRQRLQAVRERLPNEKEIPPLYRTVSDLAFQSGLAVAIFQPRAPQPKEFYSEVPITLNAEMGYHQLGTFFDRLARLPRVVNVADLKLTGIRRPTGSMRAEMTLVSYMLKTEPLPPGGKR